MKERIAELEAALREIERLAYGFARRNRECAPLGLGVGSASAFIERLRGIAVGALDMFAERGKK